MNGRPALLLAVVSLLLQPGAPVPAPPGSSAVWAVPVTLAAQTALQDQTSGSTVPCAVPLTWRVAEIDSRFEVGESDARAALEEAVTLWERAVGGPLFALDTLRGFPVRFHFDDRQALVRIRQRLEADIQSTARRIEDRRARLADAREGFGDVREEYEARLSTYTERLTGHVRAIDGWNARGGAPDSVRTSLRRTTDRLQEERLALERQREELDRIQEWIRIETERLNEDIQALNRRSEDIRRNFPVTAMEAGRYAESVRMRGGRVDSVDREIRIFRFEDLDQLVLVLAHELGHALGLGHSDRPGSVMGEVLTVGPPSSSRPRVGPEDAARLRALCPGI